MESGSHPSQTRERGNPSCETNKTAAILKSTNETRNSRAEHYGLRPLFMSVNA